MTDFSIGYPMSDCPFWQLYTIHVNPLADKKVAWSVKADMNMLQLLITSKDLNRLSIHRQSTLSGSNTVYAFNPSAHFREA
jgi:hypothetical protein